MLRKDRGNRGLEDAQNQRQVYSKLSRYCSHASCPAPGWYGGSECPMVKFYEFPSFIKYSNLEGRADNDEDFMIEDVEERVNVILDIINEEAKKIGTIQPPMDPHAIGKEWLDIDFWESNYLDI